MTITLELPPETEASLIGQAQARGLTLESFLKTIILNQATASESLKPLTSLPRDSGDVDRAIDEVFDTVQLPSGVGQGAMRRENWY
jgi:phosphoribosylcarboxyaminoimidazole (NCAIR) mutase